MHITGCFRNALRVVNGQKKNNIACINLYQGGNRELHDIALVKVE